MYIVFALFIREPAAAIMASDASHMLEAALEQMDDIIAGRIFMEFFLFK